jgi:hypothetical protein
VKPAVVTHRALWAGVLVALPPLIAGLLPGDAATRCARLVWGYALAGVPYLLVWQGWRALPPTRQTLLWLIGAAAVARGVLLVLPPLLSEDVFRYVWDGATQWAGLNPFRYAPAAEAVDHVARDAALAGVRAEIGHAHLSTIYPPAAQITFAAVVGVAPSATLMRAAMAALDLVTVGALWAWAARAGRRPTVAALYAFAPVAVLESAVGGHIDALGVAGLVGAGALLAGGAAWRGGAALAVGVGAKLLPVVALPTLLWRGPRRAVVACVAVVVATALPYLGAGEALLRGLTAYGHRWRGNEGAFAVIAWPFEQALAPLDGPADVPTWVVRLTRALVGHGGAASDQVWGDEVAFAAAKAIVAALLAAFGLYRFARARGLEGVFGPFVAALLLLAPVVHPWYLLWLLPFACLAVAERPAGWGAPCLGWSLLVWIAYLPRPGYLRTGDWVSDADLAAAQYLPVWFGLAIVAARGLKRARATAPTRAGAGP